MPLQIFITHPSLNTMKFKNIVTSVAIATGLTTAIFTPTQAHAMTGEEAVKVIQVIGDYMDKLQKIFQPAPTTPQPEVPAPDPSSDNNQPSSDTTEG
jgi:hypothetical protein